MDPLSILGSVAGVATVGTQLSKELFDLISAVRHAPEDMEAVATEMSILTSSIEQLHDTLTVGKDIVRQRFLMDLQRTINNIEATQTRISGLIQGDSKSIIKRVKWLKSKSLLDEVQKHKITIALQVAILSAALQAKTATTDQQSSAVPLAKSEDRFRLEAENLVRAGQLSLLPRSRGRPQSDLPIARPPSPPLLGDGLGFYSAEASTDSQARAAEEYQERIGAGASYHDSHLPAQHHRYKPTTAHPRNSRGPNHNATSDEAQTRSAESSYSDFVLNPPKGTETHVDTAGQGLDPSSSRVANFGSRLRLEGDAATFLYKLVFQGGTNLEDEESEPPGSIFRDDEEDGTDSDLDYEDNSEVSLEPNVTFQWKKARAHPDLLRQPRTNRRILSQRVVKQLLLEWTSLDDSKPGHANAASSTSREKADSSRGQEEPKSSRKQFPPAPYVEDADDAESEAWGGPKETKVYLSETDITPPQSPRWGGANQSQHSSEDSMTDSERAFDQRPPVIHQPTLPTLTHHNELPVPTSLYGPQYNTPYPQARRPNERDATEVAEEQANISNPWYINGGINDTNNAPGFPQRMLTAFSDVHRPWPNTENYNLPAKPSILLLPPAEAIDPSGTSRPPELDVRFTGLQIRLQDGVLIPNPEEYVARHGLSGKAIMGSLAGERTMIQDSGMAIFSTLVLGHSLRILYIRGSDLRETWFLDAEPVHVHFYHCSYQPQFYPTKDNNEEAKRRDYLAIGEESVSDEALAQLGIGTKGRDGGRVLLDPTVTWVELRDAFKLTLQLRWMQQYRKLKPTFYKSVVTFRRTHGDMNSGVIPSTTAEMLSYSLWNGHPLSASNSEKVANMAAVTRVVEPAERSPSLDAIGSANSDVASLTSRVLPLEDYVGQAQPSNMLLPENSDTMLGTSSTSDVDVFAFQVAGWDESQTYVEDIDNESRESREATDHVAQPIIERQGISRPMEPTSKSHKTLLSRLARWKLGRMRAEASVVGAATS